MILDLFTLKIFQLLYLRIFSVAERLFARNVYLRGVEVKNEMIVECSRKFQTHRGENLKRIRNFSSYIFIRKYFSQDIFKRNLYFYLAFMNKVAGKTV